MNDRPTGPAGDESLPALPLARIAEGGPAERLLARATSRLWVVTAVCLLLAVVLVWTQIEPKGYRILIHFPHGHGLEVGDAVRYRGIDVGQVRQIALDEDLQAVTVTVELTKDAQRLAREGSRFWIERPRINLARTSGLETVMGPKYIGVQPGPLEAPRVREFEGLVAPQSLLDASPVELTIRFREGHGLAAGDPLKHRGISVGEVTAVNLTNEMDGVHVVVQLAQHAAGLARAGSRFWIERPRIKLGSIRGLETLVGGRYLAVLPGPQGGERMTRFDGLETAPGATDTNADSLEIVLESLDRLGLERGSPVTFRGIEVGHIISVELANDAATVEARVSIQPDYRALIRESTRFWSNSGLDVRVGLSGFQLDADTLSTIAAGGVELATPDDGRAMVTTGHRFQLAAQADEEWLTWQPRLPVGNAMLPDGLSTPRMLLATARRGGRFGTLRRRRRSWMLPLEGGVFLAPAATIVPQSDRDAVEIGGKTWELAPAAVTAAGSLAMWEPPEPVGEIGGDWPRSRLRVAERPEDLILFAGSGMTLPIAKSRLQAGGAGWKIDGSVPVSAEWNGASAVAARDGAVIGLLVSEAEAHAIAPLTDVLLTADIQAASTRREDRQGRLRTERDSATH